MSKEPYFVIILSNNSHVTKEQIYANSDFVFIVMFLHNFRKPAIVATTATCFHEFSILLRIKSSIFCHTQLLSALIHLCCQTPLVRIVWNLNWPVISFRMNPNCTTNASMDWSFLMELNNGQFLASDKEHGMQRAPRATVCFIRSLGPTYY